MAKNFCPECEAKEAAAGGAIIGAGAAAAATGEKKKKRCRYKMKLYKEFGSTLRPGEEQYVYAKMVEITDTGAEIDRPDLSAAIRITSANDSAEVTQTGMVGEWQTAHIRVPSGARGNEAVIRFSYSGECGTFINNVHFGISPAEDRVLSG